MAISWVLRPIALHPVQQGLDDPVGRNGIDLSAVDVDVSLSGAGADGHVGIGGFPMPTWLNIAKGLLKGLKALRARRRNGRQGRSSTRGRSGGG